MRLSLAVGCGLLASLSFLASLPAGGAADEGKWITLSAPNNLDAWKAPTGDWFVADDVGLDPLGLRRSGLDFSRLSLSGAGSRLGRR